MFLEVKKTSVTAWLIFTNWKLMMFIIFFFLVFYDLSLQNKGANASILRNNFR
jgi:hypothetical protein